MRRVSWVRCVVLGSVVALMVSASPVVASSGGVGTTDRGSAHLTSVKSDELADVFGVEVTRHRGTAYLNSGDLIEGDLSVETDDDGLTRVYGTGSIAGVHGDSARVDVDVVRRGSSGRYGYSGKVRLKDGSYELSSRVRVHTVQLTGSNVVTIDWYDLAGNQNITMTVEDLVSPDDSGCPSGDTVVDDESSITDLLEIALGGAAKGAGGVAGSDLFGWALSAVGVGGDDTETQIASELEVIEGTLVDICNELAAIDAELQKLVCANDALWLAQPASDIDNWYAQYLDFVIDTQQGAPPTKATIQPWVEAVLDTDDGVLHAITQLRDLGTASTSSGSIADCIESQTTSAGVPDSDTLDDRPYYEAIVAPIQNWFYGYSTLGFTVLAEAHHYQAWLDAGEPTGTINTELPDLCTDATGDVAFDCLASETAYNTQVLPWLEEEIAIGGAPYGTDDYVMINGWSNGDGIGRWLIATNLEAYTEAAGGACADPLTSTHLCGPLVTEPATDIPSVEFGPYGVAGNGKWVKADAPVFNHLLSGYHDLSGSDSKTTAAGWLCKGKSGATATTDCSITNHYGIDGAGLGHADKIVVFNRQTTDNFGNKGTFGEGTPVKGVAVWCFFDGAVTRNRAQQPFCDSGAGARDYKNLVELHNVSSLPKSCSKKNGKDNIFKWLDANEWTRTNGPVSDEKFYNGDVCIYENDKPQKPTTYDKWSTNPSGYAGVVEPKSYGWPVLDWTILTCTDEQNPSLEGKPATEALNPGGVATMCGRDYGLWLADLLPIVE